MTSKTLPELVQPQLETSVRGYLKMPERFCGLAGKNPRATYIKGDCLEPVISDGDMIIFDPDRWPKAGEYVVLYPKDPAKKPGVKRLVLNVMEGALNLGPGSNAMPLVVVETLNPPNQYAIPADELLAIHPVVGWMSPEEYEPLVAPEPFFDPRELDEPGD